MENNNAHSASLVLADYIEPSHHPTAAMTNNRRPDEDSGAETVYDEDNADNYGNRKNDSTCSDLTVHRTKSNRDRRKQQDPESSNGIYFSSASLDSKSIVDGASIESTEAYMCDDDGSKDRVTVNLERSSLQKFLFVLTPEVFAYKSDTYCMVSLKIHPAFCKENVMLRISNDGWRASVTFTMPKTYMDPRNILGVAIDQEHVLYQAVKDEIFRFQKQFENRPKAFLHLNLPFAAEPKTADDIFGKGSGQTANLIPLTKGKKIRPDHFAGNVVFFFKKRGNSFHVSTRSSAHLHDARRSYKSASTTNNGPGENGDDSYMSHPDLSGVKRKKK